MFLRLMVAVVFLTLLAGGLLGLREQRLAVRHEMAKLHAEMDRTRQHTWDLQVDVEGEMRNQRLWDALEHSGLAMEPVTQARPPLAPDVRVVQGPAMRSPNADQSR